MPHPGCVPSFLEEAEKTSLETKLINVFLEVPHKGRGGGSFALFSYWVSLY